MIDFRYHLVSTIAVFLALAVGMALGSTALQGSLHGTLGQKSGQAGGEIERLRAEKDAAERLGAGGDQLVGAHAANMLDDRLSGVRVAVVEPPGVSEEVREGVIRRIEQAGGTVPVRLALSDTYLDPGESAFVRELTDQLALGVTLPKGSAHERSGALLAHSLLRYGSGTGDSSGPADAADSDGADSESTDGDESGFEPAAALAAFAEAGLVSVHGDPDDAADTAVLLAPGEPAAAASPRPGTPGDGGNEDADGDGIMLATADALHSASAATVLVGAPSSTTPGGLLARARAEEADYSTADAAGRAAGDVAAAMVLAAAIEGSSGDYGIAEGTDGFAPGTPTGPGDGSGGSDQRDQAG